MAGLKNKAAGKAKEVKGAITGDKKTEMAGKAEGREGPGEECRSQGHTLSYPGRWRGLLRSSPLWLFQSEQLGDCRQSLVAVEVTWTLWTT